MEAKQQMQFCVKKSAEEMDAESKAATAKEMQKLLSALSGMSDKATPNGKADSEPDSDAESVASSDSSSPPRKRRRSQYQKSDSTNRLESRIHYMKLDLANQMVDLQRVQDELAEAKRKLSVYETIDIHLAILKSATNRCSLNNDLLTVEQLDKKYELIKSEMHEHLAIVKNAIAATNYSEVKLVLRNSIQDEIETMHKALDELYWVGTKKAIIRGTIKVSFITLLVVLGFCLLYMTLV